MTPTGTCCRACSTGNRRSLSLEMTNGLALLGGPQDRKWPLTCGAKGTRTPGLLDANHIFRVFLRRWTCPDGPSSCGDCRQLSVDVAWSLAPLALCLALP